MDIQIRRLGDGEPFKWKRLPSQGEHITEYDAAETDTVTISCARKRHEACWSYFFRTTAKRKETLLFERLPAKQLVVIHFLDPVLIHVGSHPKRMFYDRSINVLHAAENHFTVDLLGQGSTILVVISLDDRFVLRLDRPLVFTPSSSLLIPQNLIATHEVQQLLSLFLFHQSAPEWEDFISGELLTEFTHSILNRIERGPFQPLTMSATQLAHLNNCRMELLQVMHRPVTVKQLMRLTAIKQIAGLQLTLKQLYAVSLKEWITELRMVEAQKQLQFSTLTIKQIAAASGYKNVFYFSRAFSRFNGIPPATFRRQFEKKYKDGFPEV